MSTKSTRRALNQRKGRSLRFEPLEARRLLATFAVSNTADSGAGSLRQAIDDANLNPGADAINFNIGGGGLQTIAPLTALPGIIDATNIDATTQPGYAGSPLIVLNGAAAGMTSNGLLITASDSVVRGLVINGFRQSGIRVEGGDRNVFEDNYIGTDASGTVAVPNGNGPNPSGTVDVTTGAINLVGSATNAASDNRIEGNLISGNNTAGVRLRDGGGNVVKDNLIGTDVAGTVAMGNLGFGVIFNPNGRINNRIEGNVLSATRRAPLEGGDGIKLQNRSNQNVIVDNMIGTDLTGTIALGNERWGIFIQAACSGNLIQDNLISGNREDGVQVRDGGSDNNIISQNLIGTDVTGSIPLGNGFAGIDIRSTASNNTVVGNTIAYNGRAGVIVQSLAINNRITQNSIHSNGGLGIDLLLPTGPNPNDPQDPDVGGNRLQNYPFISSVVTGGGTTTIQGRLNSTPLETFTIEFFRNQTGDPSGFGEGETFIGDTTVTTDSFGNANFSLTFAAVPAGEVVTATATDSSGNTSEFSGTGRPFAVNDSYIVAEDGTLVANDADGTATVDLNDNGVLANDSDPDDDPLTATVVSGPANGNLSFNTDGTFSYTPFTGFFGSDSFTYIANDGQFDSTLATVLINVFEVNDAPVAGDDSAATTQDVPVSGNVLSNDTDPDNTDGYFGNEDYVYASLVTGPAHGTLLFDSWTGDFTYTPTTGYFGTDSFTYQAVDSDGAPSNLATVTITVAAAEPGSVYLVADACNPGETALVVNGTVFDDNIQISPTNGGINVSVNGVSQGPFNPTGRIIVFGNAGNDDIQLAGSIPNEAWLYGDAGNDRLNLGNGGGIAFGGDGNDHLLGGNSRDILVGGDGMDRLIGNSGDDILLAAMSLYDDRFTSASHEAAWCGIYHEWTRTDHSYQQRVDNITDGTGTFDGENGSFFLNSTTVLDDDDADQLTGAAARDWFFANLDGLGAHDTITDLKSDEFADELHL